jgi:hypothetical protein
VLARLALVCRGSDEIRPNSILTHSLDPGSCSWRQPELIRPSPNSFCQLTKPILVAKLGTPMLTKKKLDDGPRADNPGLPRPEPTYKTTCCGK